MKTYVYFILFSFILFNLNTPVICNTHDLKCGDEHHFCCENETDLAQAGCSCNCVYNDVEKFVYNDNKLNNVIFYFSYFKTVSADRNNIFIRNFGINYFTSNLPVYLSTRTLLI